MSNDRHFCNKPSVALCGERMDLDDFAMFYDRATSCFASVTCDGCRREVFRTKLAPGGFPFPETWGAWTDVDRTGAT